MNAHPVTAWLAARGIAPEEIVAVCWKPDGADFKALAVTAEKAASAIPAHLADADCWVSTNPLRPGLKPGRKGCEVDVVRWACVPADLDVKQGGMPTFEAAQNVIETLSGMLGVQPSAVVMTGHGLQPVWALEPQPGVTDWSSSANPAFKDACALSRRWGALVRHVAALHGGAADSVFNLDRVLRAPGTVNRKPESEPVATTLDLPGGGLLSLDRLRQALDGHTPPTPPERNPERAISPRPTPEPGSPRSTREGAYERAAIQGELARLAALPQPWHEGAGWDLTTYKTACNLIELANSEWTALTIEEAEMLLHENAPKDHAWGERQVNAKWQSALHKIGDEARPAPPEQARPRDDDPFTAGYVAQAAVASATGPARTRPSLRVGRPADMLTWARANLGTGATADVLRRGTLVRIPRLGDPDYAEPSRVGDDDGPAKILTLRTPGQVSALLSARFELYAVVGEERRRALFPAAAARELVDAPDLVPSVRELAGVTHAPIVRADGSVLSTPGYDAATRLAYLPERGLVVAPVPELPTSAQVAAAVDLLMFMLSGFRFLSDSDRANYLGALLTPLLRALAPPPYKLLALGAPMPGSGKTLLAELLRIVHGAVLRGEMPLGDELPKELTTILATTTAPVVVFDNVTGVLRSSKLSALLTSGVYESRILGVNEQINVPNDRLWVVTGNNLALGGDLPRRTLSVTIDPGVPDPHMRSGFAIPDLRGWTRAHRGELLHALLVLVRSWHGVGRPVPAPVSDNYETWRQTVGGILTHAGVPGDFDAPSTAPEAVGADDSEWAEFLAVIERVFGTDPWTAAELLSKVDPSSHYGSELGVAGFPIKLEDLPAELAEKMRGQTGPRALARPLGSWLRNRAGRWAGGRCARPLGQDRNGIRSWRVEVFPR